MPDERRLPNSRIARALAQLDRLPELFAEGNDREVARRLKAQHGIVVSLRTIGRYRRALDVTAHPPGRPPGLRARNGGEQLRSARLSAGLSMNELAKRADTDSGTISRLEGIWDFGLEPELAGRIAEALASEVDILFTVVRPAPELAGTRSRPATSPVARFPGPRTTTYVSRLTAGLSAFYASPASGPLRRARSRTMTRVKSEEWKRGTGAARARIEHCSGPVRRKWKLRWAPKPGPHKSYDEAQAETVRAMKRSHPTWGYRTIAAQSGLSFKAVRGILAPKLAESSRP